LTIFDLPYIFRGDMDGVQQPNTQQQNPASFQRPSYQQTSKPGKKAKPWVIVLMLLAIVLMVGGILYFLGSRGQNAEPSPSPEGQIESVATFEPEPTETPMPVNKEEISIQILNGTGIPGEATYLQGQLRDLGFTEIEVGNADKQDYEDTQVTYSSDVSSEAMDELTSELESIFQNVDTSRGSVGSYDIQIITGLRKGQTPKPAATATPKATTTPTPTSSPTASPTPTATP
jgi:hypothetical protein